MEPIDRRHDIRAAIVLAVLIFLVFAGLVVGILTDTFPPKDDALAWTGAGFVGLGAIVFGAWAVILHLDVEMEWADRIGGDLLLVGVAAALVATGVPTFAAGVL